MPLVGKGDSQWGSVTVTEGPLSAPLRGRPLHRWQDPLACRALGVRRRKNRKNWHSIGIPLSLSLFGQWGAQWISPAERVPSFLRSLHGRAAVFTMMRPVGRFGCRRRQSDSTFVWASSAWRVRQREHMASRKGLAMARFLGCGYGRLRSRVAHLFRSSALPRGEARRGRLLVAALEYPQSGPVCGLRSPSRHLDWRLLSCSASWALAYSPVLRAQLTPRQPLPS